MAEGYTDTGDACVLDDPPKKKRRRKETKVVVQFLDDDGNFIDMDEEFKTPEQAKRWIRQEGQDGQTYRIIRIYGTYEITTKTVTKTKMEAV